MKEGRRRIIPVSVLEFVEGGSTIWVHGPEGGTVLRLKTFDGKVHSSRCDGPTAHVDAVVSGDINICLPSKVRRLP